MGNSEGGTFFTRGSASSRWNMVVVWAPFQCSAQGAAPLRPSRQASTADGYMTLVQAIPEARIPATESHGW